MQYQTITLELLRQRPQIHNELKKQRKLPETMELYANQLKASHLELIETLSKARPVSDPSQIKSEAMEIAIKELEERLDAADPTSESHPTSGSEGPTLDGAMAYLRRHTRPE